ncbi:RHS repeat-associated core domain-containing protein [Saccharopolyspora tripterygii]
MFMSAPIHTQIVTGGEFLGVRPWYPLERHPISDRIEVLVHLSTGNLVVHVRDLTIEGRCDFALNLNHTFNAQAPPVLPPGAIEPSFGTHWASLIDTHLFADTGSVRTLVDPTGWYASFQPDGSGGWISPAGINATLHTEPDSTYRLVFHGSEEVWRFDTTGLLTSQACRNGQTITFAHRGDGRVETITDTRGRVTTLHYDAQAQLESIEDPTGHVFGNYVHDTDGRLLQFDDRGGNTTYLSYDTSGNLIELIDPNGHTWSAEYDTTNRVTAVHEPLPGGAAVATWAYVYGTSTTEVTDPNSNTSTFTFDSTHRQLSATDALGHARGTTWTANNDVNTTTDPTGASFTYDYDATTNNLIGTELPTGAAMSIDYTDTNHPFQPTSITDPQGTQVELDYDAAGNLLSAYNTNLGITVLAYTYNLDGSVATRTDGKGAVTTYDYDSLGQQTAVHPPDPRGVEHYTYDELSRQHTVRDGNGTVLEHSYDLLDRPTAITDVTGGIRDVREQRSYDRNGNLTATHSPSARMNYTYTPRGQVQSQRTTTGDVLETVGYGYDPAGNIVWLQQPCATVRYGYDAAYRCTTLTLPDGAVMSFDYDTANRRTDAHYPGGFHQHTDYDLSGRVTAVEARDNANVLLDRSTYRYETDTAADSTLIREITGWFSPHPTGQPTLCTYDGLNRLTQAGPYTYTFDDATNLTSTNEHTFTINAADEYTHIDTTPLGWDRAGQLTADEQQVISEYSATYQLTGTTGPEGRLAEFAYATSDAVQLLEGLYGTAVGTVHDTYTHTALGLGAYTRDGVRTTIIRDPDGRPIAFDTLGGPRHIPHTDPQRTVHALVTPEGQVTGTYAYTPYGDPTPTGQAANHNPLRWLGMLHDPQGRYHLGHRYYQPHHARFTQPDPSGQEINPYTYAFGDPINKMDSIGLNACTWTLWGAGQIFTYAGLAATATGVGTLPGAVIAGAGVAFGAASNLVC